MNRLVLLIIILLVFVSSAWAVKLSDYRYFNYEVKFTNPVCMEYTYGSTVYSNSGKRLDAKPKNVFCSKADYNVSASRESSPEHKLLEWIRSSETTEIFMAYLSFSNRNIMKALCSAIEKNNVKVTMVLDNGTDLKRAESLLECKPEDSSRAPVLHLRGHEGGLGYAHNKLFFVNPDSAKVRIAFSSGNMSSGTTLHHENWHFVTTEGRSYFAKVHHCLKNGMIDHGSSKAEYSSYVASCRKKIRAKEESDIKVYFVPGEGRKATKRIVDGIRKSKSVDIAAHRFSYSKMVSALSKRLSSGKRDVRLIADDDLYWAGHGEEVGPNMPMEYDRVSSLVKKGLKVKYMETNHWAHLLHHNKFFVFNNGSRSSVFCGAGNLTGSAFSKNYENFYYITIPQVVAAFKKQYNHMWSDLASRVEDLPSENIHP